MTITTIDVRADLPAAPAQVYERLEDRSSWPEWSGHSPSRTHRVERHGNWGSRGPDGCTAGHSSFFMRRAFTKLGAVVAAD